MTFTLKRNDTSPAIRYQLLAGGSPADISGYAEVRFLLVEDGPKTDLVIEADTTSGVTVENATDGVVRYDWTDEDTATEGRYLAEWEVTYSDGATETFPNTGYITVRIVPDLGPTP